MVEVIEQFARVLKCDKQNTVYCTNLPTTATGSAQLHNVLQLVIGIVAALSVLFIVIGGLRFVLSDGDPQGVSKARSTVVYALIGLFIAIAAEAIVAFAISTL